MYSKFHDNYINDWFFRLNKIEYHLLIELLTLWSFLPGPEEKPNQCQTYFELIHIYAYYLETMTISPKPVIGAVESILSRVKPDWWTSAFQETYLRTDGDVVENPAITESECLEILNTQLVRALWARSARGTNGVSAGADDSCHDDLKRDVSSLRVLDLCCGQGRHTICLAQHLPGAQFHGHDHSVFLVNLARERARAAGVDGAVTFTAGYANNVPADKGSFDIVLMMGNSLGYGESVDDVEILREVYRVLKPGGVFLLDLPDADKMTDNVKDRSWEWVDGRDKAALMGFGISPPLVHGAYDYGQDDRKLLACRERELSAEKDKLATREIVIDLERGVVADLFYSVHLYKLNEITDLLEQCGLSTSTGVPNTSSNNTTSQQQRIARPDSHRDEDLGMMEYRNLVVAQRPNFIVQDLPVPIGDDLDTFAHPALSIRLDPYKGKSICATTHIRAGTLLIIDQPYACVPSSDPVPGEWVPCSRHECNRCIPRIAVAADEGKACRCCCNAEVVWCNASCRALDEQKHALECAWLAAYSDDIVKRHGSYDFDMLWLVVRILVQRTLQLLQHTNAIPSNITPISKGEGVEDSVKNPSERPPIATRTSSTSFGNNTWLVIEENILSNRDRFPSQRIEHWTSLASTYLVSQPFSTTPRSSSSSASTLDLSSIVDLICKEETNSFCQYPKPNGVVPVPIEDESQRGNLMRGTPYGLAFHTRAALFNHSCSPNVSNLHLERPGTFHLLTSHVNTNFLPLF